MDWATICTIAGTLLAALAFFYGFLRNFKNDINSHIDRIDSNFQKMDQRITETNKRMDGVYHILIKRLDPKTDP